MRLVALLTLALCLGGPALLAADDLPADVAGAPEQAQPLGVGAQVPDGPVRDLAGGTTTFHAALAGRPSVVIFYRGGWCPYCNLQMGQLISLEPRLQALGYQILAISPDKPEKMRESIERHKLNYTLLSDSRLDLARKFGLAYRISRLVRLSLALHGIDPEGYSGETHHWLPVPAAYVVDPSGKVRFAYFNPDYTVRVDPEKLYQAAQAALTQGAP
jgi:peroxiredoxin